MGAQIRFVVERYTSTWKDYDFVCASLRGNNIGLFWCRMAKFIFRILENVEYCRAGFCVVIWSFVRCQGRLLFFVCCSNDGSLSCGFLLGIVLFIRFHSYTCKSTYRVARIVKSKENAAQGKNRNENRKATC